jgi:Mn2+/Fe2+ NRAMP family transporter
MLFACRNKKIIGDQYQHPTWLIVFGILAVLITAYAGITSLSGMAALWK